MVVNFFLMSTPNNSASLSTQSEVPAPVPPLIAIPAVHSLLSMNQSIPRLRVDTQQSLVIPSPQSAQGLVGISAAGNLVGPMDVFRALDAMSVFCLSFQYSFPQILDIVSRFHSKL